MADVSDIKSKLDAARQFAIKDGAVEARIRSLDGVEMLLIELIREMRDINEKLDLAAAKSS